MTSARSYFFALVITAAAMAAGNIAAHEGSRLAPPHDSGPPPASGPSIFCAPALQSLGGQNEIRAALIEGMVKFFRDSQIDSDRLREFLRDPLAAQINWNSGADLNSHAQAITLFQTFARDLQPAEQSQLITELTTALQAILAERQASQTIARKLIEQTTEIPDVKVFNAGSEITSVAFSPDGKYFVTGSHDGSATLWNSGTGEKVRIFKYFDSPVTSVVFSSDASSIFTISVFGPILWDAATGKLLNRPNLFEYLTNFSSISPDAKLILAGLRNGNAVLIELETRKEVGRLLSHSESILSAAFSPDGKHILTGSIDRTAVLSRIGTGQELHRFMGHAERVTSVAFSPDGNYILTGSYDKTARLSNFKNYTSEGIFRNPYGLVTSVAFSPNGTLILTGAHDKKARLWSIETGEALRTFQGHNGWITSVAFSPNGQHILTGSDDRTARLWPLPPQFWPRPQSTKAAAP